MAAPRAAPKTVLWLMLFNLTAFSLGYWFHASTSRCVVSQAPILHPCRLTITLNEKYARIFGVQGCRPATAPDNWIHAPLQSVADEPEPPSAAQRRPQHPGD